MFTPNDLLELDKKVAQFMVEFKKKDEPLDAQKLFRFSNSTQYSDKFESYEGTGGFDKVDDGAEFTVADRTQGYEKQLVSEDFGRAVEYTNKDQKKLRDRSPGVNFYQRFINDIPDIKVSAIDLMERYTHTMLNWGFENNLNPDNIGGGQIATTALAGVGADAATPVLSPDAKPIFGKHQWRSGAEFINQDLNNATLSEDALHDLRKYARLFKDHKGRKQQLEFDTIVVAAGSDNEVEAWRIFQASYAATKQEDVGYFKSRYKIISTPYLENERAWFAMNSKMVNPLEVIINQPFMANPMRPNHTTEGYRINMEQSYRFGCTRMPIAWYGSNGSGDKVV